MDIISIHIPKTGGTTLYAILKQVYGDKLSKSYRRRDLIAETSLAGVFAPYTSDRVTVLHGHFHYLEIKHLHQTTGTKLITWLRDPVKRILSNYHFFKALFDHPERNPLDYERNKHRSHQTLMEYAALPECQNRMDLFLNGAVLQDFFFIGIQDNFESDLKLLANKLDWPNVSIPFKNVTSRPSGLPNKEELEQLISWNIKDVALYVQVMKERELPYPVIYDDFL
ncbi:sulfotransferase domain-containing protein [Lewinella cohaerens]|uniref:sulfotransferase domain-containing protein n=1 Tax=Lewinella cohaerens TaxID=70995 RepID=UPI00036E3E27|nr:sulfotransferase domain-containing protein [Lewinella cohaerens]